MIKQFINEVMQSHFGALKQQVEVTALHGGSINQVFRVTDHKNKSRFLVKANDAPFAKQMFEAEVDGLARLQAANAFRIPAVLGTYQVENWHLLFMEYIQPHPKAPAFGEQFAQALYSLHQQCAPAFGLERDNFIGTLRQSNKQHDDWTGFFVDERLAPLIKSAVAKGLLHTDIHSTILLAKQRISDLFPPHPPACLHGDLWSGNVFVDSTLRPVVFDPAVYFGHPFMDLGMMKLFGGFNQEVFQVYADQAAYHAGWEEGLELANLYPLLVHVNLFGEPYVHQTEQIINRFLH
jgi:fructosamine-3-kinase